MNPTKSHDESTLPLSVAVIGAGPAGLMAAEVIANAGYKVHIYDAKPSSARKFLLAGVGGMNITHAEDWPLFIRRYGHHQANLNPLLENFGPTQLRQWIHDLGIDTFVGSSGRVFPADMKAAPLLRAWLHRLREHGVEFFMRHRCMGMDKHRQLHFQLHFETPTGDIHTQYSAIVLAMGGASWPQLGSDGAWQHWLNNKDITLKPLLPSNCGFNVHWSDHLKQHFSGSPIKNARLSFVDSTGICHEKRGEFVLSHYGVEGSAIYALSAPLRDALLSTHSPVTLSIDLLPDRNPAQIEFLLEQHRHGMSLGNVLRKKLKLTAADVALIHECIDKKTLKKPAAFSKSIKALPVILQSTRPITEAISSAGGIGFENLTDKLMLNMIPGVFCAGEMLDWEAPTGGYLLTACFATGKCCGEGVVQWLGSVENLPE